MISQCPTAAQVSTTATMSIVDIARTGCHADVVAAAAASFVAVRPLIQVVVVVAAAVVVVLHRHPSTTTTAQAAIAVVCRVLVRGHIPVRDVLGTATSIGCCA